MPPPSSTDADNPPSDAPQAGGGETLATLTRPLHIGLSIGHPRGSTGSIGPFVRLANGRPGLLSTSAVLAPHGARGGDLIHQPGPIHRPVLTGLSRVAELHAFTLLSQVAPSSLDFGCAMLLDGIACTGNVLPPGIPQAGRPLGAVVDPDSLRLGDEVAFVGVGSRYVETVVTALDVTFKAASPQPGRFTFTGAIGLGSASQPTSLPGDGGALVWRRSDAAIIGMVLASDRRTDGSPTTYALPVGPALNRLGATLLGPADV